MNYNVVTLKTRRLLEVIMQTSAFDDFRLVGGTALSLQCGHRTSVDLDLFTSNHFSITLMHAIETLGPIQTTVNASDDSIEIFINNVNIHFRFFGYPSYKQIVLDNTIRLAHPIDIGLMKILALTGRNTRKDIIDLYIINQNVLPLGKLLNLFDSFYPQNLTNSYQNIMTLFDNKQLQNQPMPIMLVDTDWETMYKTVRVHIKNFFEQKTKAGFDKQ